MEKGKAEIAQLRDRYFRAEYLIYERIKEYWHDLFLEEESVDGEALTEEDINHDAETQTDITISSIIAIIEGNERQIENFSTKIAAIEKLAEEFGNPLAPYETRMEHTINVFHREIEAFKFYFENIFSDISIDDMSIGILKILDRE